MDLALHYSFAPTRIEPGLHWVVAYVENRSQSDIVGLEVMMFSQRPEDLSIYSEPTFLPLLKAGAGEVIPFHISASHSCQVYLSFFGWRKDHLFSWHSHPFELKVGDEVAEIIKFNTKLYHTPSVEKRLDCEIKVKSRVNSKPLQLELWTENPAHLFKDLTRITTKPLQKDEEVLISHPITLLQEGTHQLHAYLYQGKRMVDHEVSQVQVNSLEPITL